MNGEQERWHVRIAPGEVKLLTLEQIDDLFRLDMIDEDTLLRQDGALEWLPLRVVAGLDEDDAAAEQAPVARSSAPPPPSARSAPPPPVRSVPPPPSVRGAPPPPSVRSAPPPPVRSAPPPTPSARSAPPPPPAPLPPPSERAPFAPSPSFVPPPTVSAGAPSVAPPPPPPSFAPPVPSFAPPAARGATPVSFTPAPRLARASRAEVTLIGVASLLGLLVVLQRNGVLATLFASAGQAAAYERLESMLGGPGFGTPRAVDALVAKNPTSRGP